jgi:hypothetical protein
MCEVEGWIYIKRRSNAKTFFLSWKFQMEIFYYMSWEIIINELKRDGVKNKITWNACE